MEHPIQKLILESDIRGWHRLTSAEQAALTAAGYPRNWHPGEIIALQGDQTTSMFVILSGRVKISATNYRGDHAPLATRGPAEIVGELAPITGLPRTATIQAMSLVHALVIPRDRLLAVLRTLPRIAEELLRTAAIRLQQSDRLRLESGGPDFTHRLAAILLELTHQAPETADQVTVDLHITQTELAALARVSRSTLIRGLDSLRRLSAIRTARHHITLLDPALLRSLASGTPPNLQPPS
ncbi:MAG TPA: Crp/Fnr family transcriptional regulator [Actinophytocola sp.]|uniref:Crp/Fnr family transcriptional regulator n=1 Tax=Actinophytocola sp. TaxID=1872138 RepID=UPI002DDD2920|nr:Crp/Fnr family transcriptional regulator [Actinophytocola sp.]HEV2778309.1 Crp/Fnr family transcriptional regulator [Actinophytocola sp.]